MHEDSLLVSRMSIFVLAEYILLFAVVYLLPQARLGGIPESALLISLDVGGLLFTLAVWYVTRLNIDHVEQIRAALREQDPKMYAALSENISGRRPGIGLDRLLGRVFRVGKNPRTGANRGTKWLLANVVGLVLLALWIVATAVSVSIVVTS